MITPMHYRSQLAKSSSPVILAFLMGCSVMSPFPVEGWPTLKVYEHYVSHQEMRDRCSKYTAPFSPEACAEWNLSLGECHLWFSKDFPPSKEVVRHERKHCQGYAHQFGSNREQMERLVRK